jgi:transcriptional regulator with XRE-family HTH domain
MRRRQKITAEEEEEIVATLETMRHASRVAQNVGRSFSTVWRCAERAGIELTEGRAAKGYKRLAADREAKVIEALRENPTATQQELADATGVSRSTVGRIKRGDRRCATPSPGG